MATLEQIQARMKKLQVQAEALIARRAQAALDQIRELMLKHGLTTQDIEAKAKARRERVKAASGRIVNGKVKAAATKGKLPPKYRDPKSGATWSGHARPPAWIKNVKDRSKFLIDAASAAADTAVVAKAKVATKKSAAKKSAVKKVAAKKVASAKKAAAGKSAAGKPMAKQPAAKKGPSTAAVKAKGRKPAVKKAAGGKFSGSVEAAATSVA
ncbi:H-NS histone family protein [Paraburkholderia sp. BL10I2N1]|uniref:H-NS histone family protein n=1 Tax=Paraburkholderia sp. BL10I2N1 TaxID=1938796 RepID=UPI001061E415|nr:H-NS histone family protein [Paraburkholderia sp. BL10I2N1]TDN62842.1 DNA-binding protein H-NS [Paraburkholderia sp. BL10I2N1]